MFILGSKLCLRNKKIGFLIQLKITTLFWWPQQRLPKHVWNRITHLAKFPLPCERLSLFNSWSTNSENFLSRNAEGWIKPLLQSFMEQHGITLDPYSSHIALHRLVILLFLEWCRFLTLLQVEKPISNTIMKHITELVQKNEAIESILVNVFYLFPFNFSNIIFLNFTNRASKLKNVTKNWPTFCHISGSYKFIQ